MILITPNTKFVNLGDFSIQYVEQECVESLFQIFKILNFHCKITPSEFAEIVWNESSLASTYPSKQAIQKMISKNKRVRVIGIKNAIVTNKKDELIEHLESKIKMLQLQKKAVRKHQHKVTTKMYDKYLRALSFTIREKVTAGIFKDIRAESIKFSREAKIPYGQPISISSLETVKNMKENIISGKSGLLFDDMEIEIPWEELKLCTTVKGYLYSSKTLIKVSSINVELRGYFTKYLQTIIGHGYYNMEMSVTLGTATIGFGDAEDKFNALEKMQSIANKNTFRINQSYTKPITPFATKNITKHFLCVMAKHQPKENIDLDKIYDINHSLFIDKIQHF
eukprot:179740_1